MQLGLPLGDAVKHLGFEDHVTLRRLEEPRERADVRDLKLLGHQDAVLIRQAHPLEDGLHPTVGRHSHHPPVCTEDEGSGPAGEMKLGGGTLPGNFG